MTNQPVNQSTITHRLLTAILATGVGLATLFFGDNTNWLPAIDTAIVHATASSHDIVLDGDATTDTISIRKLAPATGALPHFQPIHITDDPDRIFEQSPPSPLDYAVILESLHRRGHRNLILATRMTWDNDPGLEASALDLKLSLFDHSVIALPVTHGATHQTMPAPMRRALIPYSNIKGNHRLIPIVNQTSLPAHIQGNKHTLAGFHRIESSPPTPGHTPLLAHWRDKGLIPSLHLLTIMSAHAISPADLTIHCGKYIRLGLDGPVIPIDPYGQTKTTPKATATSLPPITATDIIPTKQSPHTTPNICLIHATGTQTTTTNLLPTNELNTLPSLASSFPTPEKSPPYHRLPLWAEIVLLIDTVLATVWFRGFNRSNRLLALSLSATLLFPLLLTFMNHTLHWFPLTPALAALFTALLIPGNKNQPTDAI